MKREASVCLLSSKTPGSQQRTESNGKSFGNEKQTRLEGVQSTKRMYESPWEAYGVVFSK